MQTVVIEFISTQYKKASCEGGCTSNWMWFY
jgi:hypothetical protein